jgi:fructose-1,6-bisphosphatase/inositol monophosphatase family enzyme
LQLAAVMDALDRAVHDAMRDAARRAIMPRFREGEAAADVHYKTPGEAVTAADGESEAILSTALAGLIPGAFIVGEEAAHADPASLRHLSSGTSWIIDPLDGTGNFAAGTGPFGIIVALAVDGVPEAGWILDPLSQRFCMARRGRGAMMGGERISAPTPAAGRRPIAALTRLFADPAVRRAFVAALAPVCEVVDSPRCAADQYPRVAQGLHDASLFTRTIAWDHAAGVLFVTEAGGVARCADGQAYRCDDPDGGLIVAACPRRWDMIAALTEAAGLRLAGAHLSAD